MADTQLRAMQRIGGVRQIATERRLRLVQAELDEANRQCRSARQRHEARKAAERLVTDGCYSNPADEQGWIARARQSAITSQAADALDSRVAETERCEAGRSQAVQAVLRNQVQQDLLARRMITSQRAATLRQEEEAADEAPRQALRRC